MHGTAAPNHQEEVRISTEKKTRINGDIRAPEVRLIGQTGEQLGVMTTQEARKISEESELDLVEISPDADPPVCRIMDFGKFIFEQRKRKAAAKKKQKLIQVKEVKFRPGTDEADYQVKLRNMLRFLEQGDKVKVTIRFRGREMAHSELGMQLLDRIIVDLAGHGVVEQRAKMEGRQMLMVVAPKKN